MKSNYALKIPGATYCHVTRKYKRVLNITCVLEMLNFNNTEFCAGEKHGILVNDKCSSCYNGVGDLLVLLCYRRKEHLKSLYGQEADKQTASSAAPYDTTHMLIT